MASWTKIEATRHDLDGVRFMARQILRYSEDGLTDWEVTFLASLIARTSPEPLSVRQAEVLLEIHDNVQRIDKIGSFSVPTLLRKCHEARFDLGDDDCEWLEALRATAPDKIRRGQGWRLLRCARDLNLVEGYMTL